MAPRSVDAWLAEYGESHQNPVNKTVHWVCVPLIALSLVGVLWDLPVPEAFVRISPVMNWGMLFLMASIVYYFILSPRLALGMVLVTAGFVLVLTWLDGFRTPLWQICAAIFVLRVLPFLTSLISPHRSI